MQSKRLGAERVDIVYRRGPEQMGASTVEQRHAQTSGVTIQHFVRPVRVHGADHVTAIELEKTRLDKNGKLRGTGDTFTMEADVVFKAIGQRLADDELGKELDGLTLDRGKIVVDAGAAKAVLSQGRSLPPAGVRDVVGPFDRGDTVPIYADDGRRIAIGVTNYGHEDVAAIRGVRSDRIAKVLGHEYGAEVVHRSNLVLL